MRVCLCSHLAMTATSFIMPVPIQLWRLYWHDHSKIMATHFFSVVGIKMFERVVDVCGKCVGELFFM